MEISIVLFLSETQHVALNLTLTSHVNGYNTPSFGMYVGWLADWIDVTLDIRPCVPGAQTYSEQQAKRKQICSMICNF